MAPASPEFGEQLDPPPGASDFVVVGAGLAGAATAWQLAEAGHEVTILERGVPADPGGSSHGSARIFRYAYPDRAYAQMAVEARQWWDELEADSGEFLISEIGAVDFGEVRDPATLARVLDSLGIENELLSAADAADRFGGINFETSVLWHPSAGVIDAEAAVTAMVGLARRRGAQVVLNWHVDSIAPSSSGYLVQGPRGSIHARRVVVAVGGWLPDLLGRLDLPSRLLDAFPALTVTQEQAFHFPFRNSGQRWPTLIEKSGTIRSYGLPGGRDAQHEGLKLAEWLGGKTIGSGSRQDRTIDPAGRIRMIDYVRHRFPGLEPTPYAETTCLFTMTPTEDFILDRYEGLTVLSPCSSHGAKFAPFIGNLAAEAAAASSASAARNSIPAVFQLGPTWGEAP